MQAPLPRSVWKFVILDNYVDFEKLYATQQQCFDQNDDTNDMFPGSGYLIVKKNHILPRRPVRTEAEWKRLYSAWITEVLLLYPHRKEELDNYFSYVYNLFRASPSDPTSAISFDAAVRDSYGKQPSRLDDLGRLAMFVIPYILDSHSSTTAGNKRGVGNSNSGSNKRAQLPCKNWNLDICKDPCKNRRKHGTCSSRQRSATNTRQSKSHIRREM
jgi:hypothetical protein